MTYNENRHREQRLEGLLNELGIKTKEINCYGSQVVITCWSQDNAERAATTLKKASFTIRGIIKSFDYNKDQSKRKTISPAVHTVYKVFARA